jgi:hypothetical protein
MLADILVSRGILYESPKSDSFCLVVNHRFETAANGAVRETSAACHIKIFFDELCAVYRTFPKNIAELELVAIQLSIRLNLIGGVFSISWVSPLLVP